MTTDSINRAAPTFFRSLIATARQGGSSGYRSPGWHLANGLHQVIFDLDDIAPLQDSLAAEDRDAVWRWFEQHLPGCTSLVPTRRRGSFIDGVFDAYADGRI